MTKILTEKQLKIAANSLLNGGVVCFPTETVYGIGVIYDDKGAFEALVKAKKRPPEKPFALMCSSLEMAKPCLGCSNKVLAFIEHFLPGEVTFLVKASSSLPEWVTLGTGVVGLRIPDFQLAQSLIEKVGKPCLVTSANISGLPTSTSFSQTKKVFDGVADAIVEGKCVSQVASTIVDVSDETSVKLIREGSLKFESILAYWRTLK